MTDVVEAAVAEIAGRNLKKVVLELGGSDPFILLSTDDLDATVDAAVAARLDNSGQSCNAAKRFIVIDSLYDEFLEQLKGQLSAAMDSITELGIVGMMTVVGLAKNVEEIFFPGDSESVKLPYNSDSLHLVRRIRDEVHRFGITFHRQKRSKGTFTNELEQIDGIGRQTADLLLKQFRSVTRIRQLPEEDLAAVVGPAKARNIHAYFRGKEKGPG